jgi:hypothetical protein
MAMQANSEVDAPIRTADVSNPNQDARPTQILARLSKLSIDWGNTTEAPEKHAGKRIYFAVQMKATRSDGSTVTSVLRLPRRMKLGVRGGDGGRRLVEALFVIRNKRSYDFAVFDAVDQVHFRAKPIQIVSILDFLPNKKAMARDQISNLVDCFDTIRAKMVEDFTKRTRGGVGCQYAKRASCACIVGERGSCRQNEELKNISACLAEDSRPAKAAKCTSIGGDTVSTV